MELNDKKIKSIIESYLSGKMEPNHCLNDFKKETELYIYNFPRAAYRKNPDICSEFYLYMLARLEGVLKNYPLEDDILFKTWFNYVLRNQFSHFMQYQKKESVLEFALEDYENDIVLEMFEKEDSRKEFLHECLHSLCEIEKLSLKFYYMPESLTSDEISASSEIFHISLQDALIIQNNLIIARYEEMQKTRDIAEKIGHINRILSDLKYRLHIKKEIDLKEKTGFLAKIARYEGTKAKRVRELDSPDRKVFQEFIPLFKNIIKAKKFLTAAKKKLKMVILFKINNQEKAV